MSYFDLFSFPAGFDLDLRELDARYRALSQKHHPDTVAGGDSSQRLAALQATTELNEAYKALREPTARAAYLLKLLGADLDEEGERTFQMDPKFLMEILELREQLDAAKKKGDLPVALEMGKQMAAREKETLAILSQLFSEQQEDPQPERLQSLARHVAALRYFRRFQDEVSAIEEASL